MSNFKVMKFGKVPVKMWTQGVPIESQALEQLLNVSKLPFIHKHIAAMPDVHWGIGATIGSVIPTRGAIIPAAVGVDIGCGMCAVQTSLKASDLPDDLKPMRTRIEEKVPVGTMSFENPPPFSENAWGNVLSRGYEKIVSKHPEVAPRRSPVHQIGTLGGGNHFVEICIDENQDVWIMLHSGSRNVGNRIGTHFIQLAKKEMERFFINLPDANLAYFPEGTEHFDDYWEAINWAQEYARMNRHVMLMRVWDALSDSVPGKCVTVSSDITDCHHNYASLENHFGQNVYVTRKGAVRARKGDLGIIPGSMGAKSFIVRGKGNPESFHSCSHGAGRAMSRKAAKEKFTTDDHYAATKGVECRKDVGVLDETPGAYKDIDAVMKAQEDLVEVLHTLKQVLCVKG